MAFRFCTAWYIDAHVCLIFLTRVGAFDSLHACFSPFLPDAVLLREKHHKFVAAAGHTRQSAGTRRMMLHRVVLTVAVSLLLVSSPAHAWWSRGHMVVAEIALRHMKPEVATLMNEIAVNFSASGPFPMCPDFVQMSCWADDAKSYGQSAMTFWHFINIPYNPENVTIKKWPITEKNVLSVIKDMKNQLSPKYANSPEYARNFAVANLVHFYGDIHQPLHSTAMFLPEFPNGDEGGNAIHVIMDGKNMTLHAVWDSMCHGSERDFVRPLSAKDYKEIRRLADELEHNYQFTDDQKAEKNFDSIVEESYNAAVHFAYEGVKNGMKLSDEYLKVCKNVAESRVALAGYRLASELNELFDDYVYSGRGTEVSFFSRYGFFFVMIVFFFIFFFSFFLCGKQ